MNACEGSQLVRESHRVGLCEAMICCTVLESAMYFVTERVLPDDVPVDGRLAPLAKLG